MAAVLTLTMNPALDLSSETGHIEPGRKTRCSGPRQTPGGGGINVARGIRTLGGEVLAVYPCGGPAGERLDTLLAEAGVPTRTVPIAADIRQNLALADQRNHKVLHLVFPGPELAEREWRACADAVLRIDPPPHYVVLSGSLPPGVPDTFYADLARPCTERGSRVVLDTTGPALEAALSARVPLFLVKPNRKEFRQLFETRGEAPGDYLRRMADLVEDGVAEAVVVTLGDRGALLVSTGLKLHLRPPPVEGLAPVGAGDSFVSALVHRLAQGGDLADAARHGVAAAAAAVKSRDPQLYRAEDLEGMRTDVRVEDLSAGEG